MISNILTALVAVEHLYILYRRCLLGKRVASVSLSRYQPTCSRQPKGWQPTKAFTMAFLLPALFGVSSSAMPLGAAT